MNRNNIGDLMLSAISKYLSEKIPLYREVDPKPLVIEALMNNGLFTNENGVLGLSKLSEGYWEVLFFAADDREARKNLIQMAAKALGDIARAKGMAELSRETGLGRESLYKALSSEGNPQLSTVLKVAKALGLQLHVKPAA
jgi:probable addiction module antidote protein